MFSFKFLLLYHFILSFHFIIVIVEWPNFLNFLISCFVLTNICYPNQNINNNNNNDNDNDNNIKWICVVP